MSATNDAASVWSVGDTKDITVMGDTQTIEIVGINHQDREGITFGLVHLLSTNHEWNSNGTAVNYGQTTLFEYLNNTVYNSLDSDLKAVIKDIGHAIYQPNMVSNVVWYLMKLFPFSATELGLSVPGVSIPVEGQKYSRFTSQSALRKKLDNGSGIEYAWWTRTFKGGTNAVLVSKTGSGSWESQSGDYGVCFGFCV